MPTNKIDVTIRRAASAALLAVLLAACAKPAPESPPPAEVPSPAVPSSSDSAPPPDATPAPDGAPDAAPAAPVQPSPEAPPPTEPTAAPKPAAANLPDVDSMSVATPSAKMSVAAEVRYSFDSAALPGQPAILHLAVIPRVPGANLKVSVKQVDGVQLAAGPANLQKAGAHGTDVYRQQYSVTRGASSPPQLRVLVTMDMASGSGFGFFSVPFEGGTTAQKLDSVKQR